MTLQCVLKNADIRCKRINAQKGTLNGHPTKIPPNLCQQSVTPGGNTGAFFIAPRSGICETTLSFSPKVSGQAHQMHSYIIHLRGDTQRQPNVQTLMATLPNAEIVNAVRGRDVIAQNTHLTRPGNLYTPHYPFPLGAGEVGCFLSHRACWQKIIDSGDDYALIAEDDLAIDPGIWPDVMHLIQTHATPDLFIRLPAKTREKPAQVVAQSGSAKLFVPRVIGLQTVCQVVGRTAAQRLLSASKTLDRPVDTFVQMHWATGQMVHTILPNGVTERTQELGGSTIQKKTRASGKMAREFRRLWYRSRVKMRPQSS